MPIPEDFDMVKFHIENNYGKCTLGKKCSCLRSGWKGNHCLNWISLEQKTFEEMIQNLEMIRKEANERK